MKRKAAEKPASGDSTRQSKRSKMSSDQSHSYAGSCHCGETKFTVTVAPITKATACNCSLCSKQATLFIYPPSKAINFQKQDSLIEYRFGKKSLGHHFCGQCGCKVAVSRGKARPEWRAINVSLPVMRSSPLLTNAAQVRLISELKPWTLEVGKYETRYMKAL